LISLTERLKAPGFSHGDAIIESILSNILRILAIETKFMTSKIAELLFPLFFDKVFGSSIKNTPVLGKTC